MNLQERMVANGVMSRGHDFEREFLLVAFPDVPEKFRSQWFKSFKHGVPYVRSIQQHLGGWRPKDPPTKLANEFYQSVARHLGRNHSQLKLFNSIGTRLDLMGVDCFFEWQGRWVTIDLTVDPSKIKSGAELVLQRQYIVNNEHHEIARRIAKHLLR